MFKGSIDHFGADRVLLAVVALDAVAGIVLWRAATAPLLLLGAATVMGLTCGGLSARFPGWQWTTSRATTALPPGYSLPVSRWEAFSAQTSAVRLAAQQRHGWSSRGSPHPVLSCSSTIIYGLRVDSSPAIVLMR